LFNGALDECVSQVRSKKKNDPPWLSPVIRRELKCKEKLRKVHKSTGSRADYAAYSQKRKQAHDLISQPRLAYIAKVESNLSCDPKGFWKFVKENQKSRNQKQAFRYKGELLKKEHEKGQAFAEHFLSVYSQSCKETDIDQLYEEVKDNGVKLEIIRFTVDHVVKARKSLKPKYSCGPDGIPQY